MSFYKHHYTLLSFLTPAYHTPTITMQYSTIILVLTSLMATTILGSPLEPRTTITCPNLSVVGISTPLEARPYCCESVAAGVGGQPTAAAVGCTYSLDTIPGCTLTGRANSTDAKQASDARAIVLHPDQPALAVLSR